MFCLLAEQKFRNFCKKKSGIAVSFFKIIKFWFANNPILIVNKDFGLGEEGRWVVKEQLFTGFDFVEQPKWGYFLQTNNPFALMITFWT